ncbi:MAG: glycoside hydrolase [Bacteroidota bacterium]|nr:glycoside hydrolase [Bacteroidota bacterium]
MNNKKYLHSYKLQKSSFGGFRGLFFFLLLFPFIKIFAQSNAIPVFVSGTEGYKSFRIPAIVKAKNGDLLAFCEGRVNGGSDFGNIKIVSKISSDEGKTWSALQIVASNDSLQAGNPAPIVDLTDTRFPKGRIFLFYNTGNGHEMELRKGKGHRDIFYKTSIDNGKTWSASTDITLQVNKINQPDINPLWNFKEDWRTYANTPGHALQFHEGKYKGRIYVAANHSSGNPKPELRDYQAHGYFTDDHGITFHLSKTVPFEGSNESTAAQLTNNSLMMNSRNQTGKYRVVSLSKDGGENWDTTFVDHNLPDPICEGSLLNVGTKDRKSILAFCNNVDKNNRDSLTLRISFDEGKTWEKNILIEQKNTGYSDIVKLSQYKTGVLYEADDYKEIKFMMVKWQ